MNENTTISEAEAEAEAVLKQLRLLAPELSAAADGSALAAAEWIAGIERKLTFLENRSHPLVFIGEIGVGKSSLLSIAANLLAGPKPSDRASLKSSAVLAVGSGRTSVCEVDIRASPAVYAGQIGLVIESLTEEEMEREIEIYGTHEWKRQQPDYQRPEGDDDAPTAQEVQRAIRNMVRYVEYQETFTENQIKKRRVVRPLEIAAGTFNSPEAFCAHLLERADLQARGATEWWLGGPTPEGLKELKRLFEAVNQGIEPNVGLPRRMTVHTPDALPGSRVASDMGLDLSLVDTRGLDGGIESRADLRELLEDPRAAIVLCSEFKAAPAESIRGVLRSMSGDAVLRAAFSRTMLLLLDFGDAEQVNGADGDREYGQELKMDECWDKLDSIGLGAGDAEGGGIGIGRRQIVAFDTLRDDRARLVDALGHTLVVIRKSAERELVEQTKDARSFLARWQEKLRPERLTELERRILEGMAAQLPASPPLSSPLQGLVAAVNVTRYASVVYATCRRQGAYDGLNLYAAIEAEASRATTVWLDGLLSPVDAVFAQLAGEDRFDIVSDQISLLKRQFAERRVDVCREYAMRVRTQIESTLKPDGVWELCGGEWGQGKGFKERVLEHLLAWLRNQPDINAHTATAAKQMLPFFREVAERAEVSKFSVHVRNFRALRNVDWKIDRFSVLIGANGSGKSTLLQIFKLLRFAYIGGWSAAVSPILRGGASIRSRGVPETEPIEIGIDVGSASWRVKLAPLSGEIVSERLTDGGAEVFFRDDFRTLHYKKEKFEIGTQLGLRALMDFRVPDPAVHSMAALFQSCFVYHDPDIWALRENGSSSSDHAQPQPRGANVLAVLRRWKQDASSASKRRYNFVLGGLREAFPRKVSDIGFIEAGSVLTAQIYPSPEASDVTPLENEANGFIQLLVLLCEVASAEVGSVLAIDEPENSLHPFAQRVFLDRARRWAERHNLTLLFATHSMVLLDELSAAPECVFVMKAGSEGGAIPTRLDVLVDRDWLEGFKFGDLYEQGEIGSNPDKG